ncbi:hypothetical protein LE181_02335 [Streptomyces sp. SCA3-4]|uniref:hypothetical protein n=1 Tax=Streptomyces sichuanensis TaxID=2871810 RepID=UPI001CE39ABE|nr:hypothetical protein [Streptomyces sichuanensis]MCA6091012.1 hypothetical protein [Streptomyces sichuanensis]
MDPIAPELVVAPGYGTAGAAGQQIWFALRNLVGRRPDPEGTPDGEGEPVALDEAAHSVDRAWEPAEALAERGRQDPVFARALETWRRGAEALPELRTGTGEVRDEISGGTFQGATVQARDINGPLNPGR